jgi:AcrR family transcriptional regulator
VSSIDGESDNGTEGGGDGVVGTRPPTKRAQQKAETRQRLLEAAREVFLESAPMTASLDEVATRAGVSRPTLFFHFGSRAELMVELLRHHLSGYRSRARRFRPGEVQPFVEAYLRAQRSSTVRLVWRLVDLVYLEHAEEADIGYVDLVAELEERVASTAGVAQDEAHQRALVLADAMMYIAKRAAHDQASEAEIQQFVRAAGRVAAAPPAPVTADGGAPADGGASAPSAPAPG